MRGLVLFIVLMLLVPCKTEGQRVMMLSQYMHNRYSINSAFAGSRDGLSVFGAFREQWMDMPGSPQAQLLTAHMPLRNLNMALGIQAFNETIARSSQSGLSFSYTYRTRVSSNTWMGFSLSGGFSAFSASWSEIPIEDPEDPLFGTNESSMGPQAGFGWSIYNQRFFGGFSIPQFFSHNFSNLDKTTFDLNHADYMLMGGYLFETGAQLQFQPSLMLRYNPEKTLPSDFSATIIYNRMIWGGLTWRTNNDVVALAGLQLLPQLRIAYSFDYSLDDIGRFNQGSHEISIQYDFKYRTHSPSTKFF